MPRTNLASLLDDTTPAESSPESSQSGTSQPSVEQSGSQSAGLRRSEVRNGRQMASLSDASNDDRSPPAEAPTENGLGGAPPVAAGEDQAISTLPRYLQLERKELRVRLDQADDLARLTRRLNRVRRGAGERITDNTLIRVAIDLLLQHSDRLAGSTEEELRKSVAQ